jgi:glucan 1,3-beta-glucosidase
VNNAATAVYSIWNWGWTFQGVTISNCQIGFDLMTGGLTQDSQTVGGEMIIDAVITNTPIGIRSSVASGGSLKGSIVLNNVKLNNVPTAVGVVGGASVLAGTSGSMTIASWAQGNIYKGTTTKGAFQQASQSSPTKDSSLLDSSGRIFGRTHPQYGTFAASQFVSIRSLGAKGDGVTDDTTVIQNALNTYGSCGKIIFFDHGVYYVTKTLTVPPGSRLVGEVWPVILGGGSNFQSQSSPQVVVKVGTAGQTGTAEITDIMCVTCRSRD